MNDRYLYRAKRKNWREFPKEMWWIEGYYAYFKQNDNHCIYYETDGFTLVCDIDISTLCACTGLKDKNGKLIWENDIIEAHLDDLFPEDISRFQVLWKDYSFKIRLEKELYDDFSDYVSELFEVAGNIFDNPELLEWENERKRMY